MGLIWQSSLQDSVMVIACIVLIVIAAIGNSKEG